MSEPLNYGHFDIVLADYLQKTNSLALESNAKRYEAYKLEQEALRIMNEEVIFAK